MSSGRLTPTSDPPSPLTDALHCDFRKEGPSLRDTEEEISALIQTLHDTGQRLEELTAGEVDTVADSDGRTFLLQHAQGKLRLVDAARQASILNALPASIALVDTQGVIVSVNDAWRRFDATNAIQGAGSGIGLNYLKVCESAEGLGASEAHQAGDGVRSVLNGNAKSFSIEYSCHSPTEQRWFLLMATPLADDHPNGAVVMHLDITEGKRAEISIKQLNRVYAVLSGINTLIVRVRDRNDLFTEACRIAIDEGGFSAALIGILDANGEKIEPVALAGKDDRLVAAIKGIVTENEGALTPMTAQAVSEKKAAVSNDSRSDPRVAFGKKHVEFGICAMAVLPLSVAHEVVGVLALYSEEINFFHAEEMKLLTELAGDIAFAIDNIEKRETLDYLAYYDALTGLANQVLFLERFQSSLLSTRNDGHKKALFLLDIERFRSINDAFGRPAGDELLKQVVERLVQQGGGDATPFARVGADRFAISASEMESVEAIGRYTERRLEANFSAPFRIGDSELRISVKVGIALFPDDGKDAETLLRNAEEALKKAKASGTRYMFFTQSMTERVTERLSLETKLRQAVDNQEFVLHYQPKVSLATGMVTGAEALIRWRDPLSGLVPPGQFIPILEETGLIQEVGLWCLRKVVEDYRRWCTTGLASVPIAVNVSPVQLGSPEFMAEIRQISTIDLHASAGLELEITESVIMADVKQVIASLQVIRNMGVSIAIDDFGTGFSSLSYLSKLPVDTLKIDRSFIIDMTAGPQGMALVSTIINLAHALRLKVVAEGVETEEQSRLLRLLGCDEMQGFLFSAALPGELFEKKYLALS